MMNYQDLCIKYNSYSQANDQGGMDWVVQQVMTATGMAYNQARDYLIHSICPEYGIVITGGRPCPPTDQNSPFHTNPNFCTTDWCVDGQGNPLPTAHPDCVCCDGNTIDVSPWCVQYALAVDNADFSQMQTIITAVSTTFNISWSQASQLLYDECLCDDNGNICTNPDWVSMPIGTSSSGQKKNYCERCAAHNTAGGQGATAGNFPIDINGGFWQPNPTSGTNYCSCCEDNNDRDRWLCEGGNCYNHPSGTYLSLAACQQSPECGGVGTIPCKYVLSEGICEKYWTHINNNDTASAMAEVNQFALNEGISSPDAYALVLKCCPDTPIVPCELTGEMCADYQSYVAGTSPYTLPQLLQHWVNMFALPTMGGYTLTTSQVQDIITRCCTPANPCAGFQDNGCCGKCDNANGNPSNGNQGGPPMTSNHPCYSWCQQNQQCCPGPITPPDGPETPMARAGTASNPIGMGNLQTLPTNFSGRDDSWDEGGFLTDPYGSKSRTQSMEDFINEVP